MTADYKVPALGADSEPLQKRPGDSRVYQVDCANLLREHELLLKVLESSGPGLVVSGARVKTGSVVEVLIGGGAVPTARPYRDYVLEFQVKTTMGVAQVSVPVRSVR